MENWTQKSPAACRTVGITRRECWSVGCLETNWKILWEADQNSGTTGNDLRGRAIEEGPGKEIGGRRNPNDTMDVRRYKAQ